MAENNFEKPPDIRVGDILTLRNSPTKWIAEEVIKNGVTMIRIVPLKYSKPNLKRT